MTPADYGIVNSMQVLSTVLVVLFTLCIDRAIYRLYFDYKTEEDKKDFLGTVTIGSLIISTLVLLLIFIFSSFIGNIYSSIPFYPFYAFIIIETFFLNFSSIPKIYFQINENATKFITYSLLEFATITILTIIFVVWLKDGATGMMKASLFSRIILAPAFWRISYFSINFKFIPKILKQSLAFGLPGIPLLLSSWILEFSDRLFIERYFSVSAVGIYSLSYKVAGLSLIFSAAFYSAYNPIYYRLANSENQNDAKKKLYVYNNYFMLTIIVISFLIAFFSKELIIIFLDSKYIESYKIVPIISLSYVISQVSSVFQLAIYQKKKVMSMVYIVFASAIVNILLNFIFVPLYGAFGAGYSTVMSVVVFFVIVMWYAKKCYYIPINWRLLLFVLGGCIGLFMVFYFFSPENIFFSLCFKLAIITAGAIFFGKKIFFKLKESLI